MLLVALTISLPEWRENNLREICVIRGHFLKKAPPRMPRITRMKTGFKVLANTVMFQHWPILPHPLKFFPRTMRAIFRFSLGKVSPKRARCALFSNRPQKTAVGCPGKKHWICHAV
jgi:hypothetical protein